MFEAERGPINTFTRKVPLREGWVLRCTQNKTAAAFLLFCLWVIMIASASGRVQGVYRGLAGTVSVVYFASKFAFASSSTADDTIKPVWERKCPPPQHTRTLIRRPHLFVCSLMISLCFKGCSIWIIHDDNSAWGCYDNFNQGNVWVAW